MKIAFKNFGCRANNFETDLLYLEAVRRGMSVVAEDQIADAYVINSCTVTSNADRDARNHVFRFKRLNPSSRVAVIGCYAQVAKDDLLKLHGVDIVLGTADKLKVLDLVERAPTARRDFVDEATGFLPADFRGSRHARANIKIQDGCNYRCSFCTIPKARGRSRSLSADAVELQVRQAAELGFREVVLTGIHLAHYGWERNEDLLSLVKRLTAIEKGPRIRLSTLDPFEIPSGLIQFMVENRRVCPFLHIALQSGDDRVLKRMRRLYLASEFTGVASEIATKLPYAFVGVDVIVGFPGETESAFANTVALLETTAWSKLHVFSFSARPNTEAFEMDLRVPPPEIAARSRALRALSEKRFSRFIKSQIGSDHEVLLEERQGANIWRGHTANFLPILVPIPENGGQAKELRALRVTGASRTSAIGQLI